MRKAEKVCNTYKEMLEYIGLTDRQAKEIYLKHQKKKTFDELAKEYDITRVRIIATCGRTGRRYNPFRDICNDQSRILKLDVKAGQKNILILKITKKRS